MDNQNTLNGFCESWRSNPFGELRKTVGKRESGGEHGTSSTFAPAAMGVLSEGEAMTSRGAAAARAVPTGCDWDAADTTRAPLAPDDAGSPHS
ncbi:unnamed protein product, partial [Iphiclides podalirius]